MDQLSLTQLVTFYWVARLGSFQAAAAHLHTTQPGVSTRIRLLEEALGVRLFDRSARQVRLTEAGRLLLGEAREIVARVDRLHELVRHGEGAVLKIGVPPDLAAAVIAGLVEGFRASDPEVRLAPAEIWTADQVNALTEGVIDVGVVRHPVSAPGLRFGQVLVQPQGVLLASGDPLAGSGEVHLADLAGRELLMPPREGEPGMHAEPPQSAEGCPLSGLQRAQNTPEIDLTRARSLCRLRALRVSASLR